MASLKIYSEVNRGTISNSARETIQQTFRSMEGREVEIIIKEKKRSLNQNKYRWGVVNNAVLKWLNDWLLKEGLPLATAEDIDIFIKDKALGVVHKITTPIGDLTIAGRFKEKDTKQFEESMECIRAYFATKGLIIPLPNEDLDV